MGRYKQWCRWGIHYTGAGTTTIFGNSKIAGALQVSTGGIVNLVGDVTFKGQGTAGFAVTLLTATSRLNVPASTTLFVDKNPAATSTGTYSIVSGSKIIVDGTIDDKAGGTTGVLAGAGAITLNATAKYVHNSNGGTLIASAVNGAANVTWVAGSICEVKGITTTTSFVAGNQSFQNFIWNCAGQTSGVNFTGTLSSVAGNLDIQNSNNQNVRFTGAAALTLNITGDLKVSGLNGISKLDICNGTGLPVVNVAGNVIIGGNSFAATLLSANRSTLKVKGNWTNGTNGVYTPGAVTTVEFNSTTANQTITKSTAEAFHNLIINNSFGSVILATDVSSDSLTLTAGKVQTGVNKITEVVAGASLTGGSSTSYVNGNLVRAVAAGASTVALPIGDASNYTPVSIGLLAGTSAGNVTASTLVPGAAPAVGPTPGGSGIDQTNYINRNWTLVFSAAAVYNATFNYINPGDVAGAPSLTNLRVGKDNAGTWSNPAATSIAGSATTNAAGGLTTGGTFSLGDATGYFITVTSGPNGSVSPGTTYVTPGGNQSFTITPAGCYSIADVTVDGVPATPLTTGSYAAGGTYDFTSVTAAHTISVTFVLNTYTITVTSGANGSITPATGSVNCGATGTYTVTPDPGYLITDVTVDGTPATALTTGSYAAGGTYDFVNVTAPHSISATFAVSCINVSITSASASPAGPLCSGQTTTLSANGVAGTNAVVTWYTGPGATGSNLGTGTSLPGQGAGTYYAYVTGDCGGPLEQSVIVGSIGNTFTGTGDWTDNARWSCGAPPSSGDNVTIAAGANATLNTNFIVSGSLTMTATSTLTVNPTRTLSVDVAATANFNGQSVTFKSDATGTASLGQVNGTLSGATNVTVERYIPNNGFRSWRLLSVPTFGSGQTIRQAWQEGTANPLPQQNNLPNYGTQITGLFSTQSAAATAGFDSITINAGMLTGTVPAGAM
ncbi:MAG: hypothetical protein IPP72_15385 [Chitinophagaceae bacterium]|nr:hypothetical protein [Chitinophagaceae bacterium]